MRHICKGDTSTSCETCTSVVHRSTFIRVFFSLFPIKRDEGEMKSRQSFLNLKLKLSFLEPQVFSIHKFILLVTSSVAEYCLIKRRHDLLTASVCWNQRRWWDVAAGALVSTRVNFGIIAGACFFRLNSNTVESSARI